MLPENFVPNVMNASAFGLLGLILIFLGYKVFDWITPAIKVEEELAAKQNVAVAIVVGAVILGVSIVVARAIG